MLPAATVTIVAGGIYIADQIMSGGVIQHEIIAQGHTKKEVVLPKYLGKIDRSEIERQQNAKTDDEQEMASEC